MRCGECNGTGFVDFECDLCDGEGDMDCPKCDGAGCEVCHLAGGFPCPKCHTECIITEPCPECGRRDSLPGQQTLFEEPDA